MTLIDTQRIIRSICSVWLMQQGLIIVVEQGQVFRVGLLSGIDRWQHNSKWQYYAAYASR